jgi:hypothetical protein
MGFVLLKPFVRIIISRFGKGNIKYRYNKYFLLILL